ncbi:hypothetical protein JCM4814A_89540 [Streptomyces phaeofaciens JCM 4814]|uniref:FAD-dependent oxidoreductase n=1 Tax=Streptomyces phaeofaciens TaxID=68254 RepID=A0A918HM07_9ACTN|nr:hypothetical protein GCM10010226_68000 [Streptomyces phaeofaciens]
MSCGFSSPAPAVAGPVLAYWLTRHGFSVTVVERAPAPRRTGGHAVDLFRRGAWATLQALGADGYRELGRATLSATRRLVEGIAAIDGLTVLGSPDASLVAIGSDTLDLFALADEARQHGFYLQPQLSLGADLPANLHLTLTGVSEQGVDALLAVIAAAADAVRPLGPPVPSPELVALVAELDLTTLDDASFAALLPAVGFDPSGAGAGRMAAVNRLLDALPPTIREDIVTRFLSALYSPHLGG